MNYKLLVTTILTCSISLISYSQIEGMIFDEHEYWSLTWSPVKYEPITSVKEITYQIHYGKKKTSYYQKRFNSEGQITEFNAGETLSELKPRTQLSYDNNGKLIKAQNYHKDKLNRTTVFIRNKEGKPTLHQKTDKKGKIIFQKESNYNDSGKLTETILFKKNGTQVKSRWLFEYDDDGKKTRSVYLNSKGKIKHEWFFGCDEEGEKSTKNHSKTQVCQWEETEGEYLIKVYQRTNEKGEIRKHVQKYTRNDTSIVETKSYDQNDLLLFKTTYDNDYSKPLIQETYKKGKLYSKWVHEYDGDLILKTERSLKGKLVYQTTYKYENDLLVHFQSFGKKNKLIRDINLDYVL